MTGTVSILDAPLGRCPMDVNPDARGIMDNAEFLRFAPVADVTVHMAP
jgi:hypothetical protein